MNSILASTLSTLDTFSHGWQAIANNVANINTDGFQGSHARYADGPGGQGVRLAELRTDTSPGALLPGNGEYVNAMREARAEGANEAALQVAQIEARAAEQRMASNVQLERETVHQVATEYAYAANAALLSTYDDMMGTVIDVVV